MKKKNADIWKITIHGAIDDKVKSHILDLWKENPANMIKVNGSHKAEFAEWASQQGAVSGESDFFVMGD